METCEKNISTETQTWTLAENSSTDTPGVVIELQTSPQTVGREDADIMVSSLVVSKTHARVGLNQDKRPFVEDLKSTNGTFVNNQRVQSVFLKDGDVVRLANMTFAVRGPTSQKEQPPEQRQQPEQTHDRPKEKKQDISTTFTWTAALLQFEELMSPGGVEAYCQPIMNVSDGSLVGYECLSRSSLTNLENPEEMFEAASRLENESELSELMRRSSIEAFAGNVMDPGIVFLNSHPNEGFGFRFEQSLRELRRSAPDLQIAIELREEVVNDTEGMEKFRGLLDELNMKLVYDDFGSDQERLNQLVQVPPDYLKFDISMIRNLDQATEHHRSLVQALVNAVHGLGIISVAEGVETQAEATSCAELGFQLAQGYFFGKPVPITATETQINDDDTVSS